MSAEFWLGVVITLIVGIPGAYLIGIIANIHSRKIEQFLERRKLLKWHKTKLQALMVFNRVKAFHEGRRDKYPYYMILASASVSCAVVASTLIVVAFFRDGFTFEFRMILFFVAFIMALMTPLLLSAIYETDRQIGRFEDYKAEFEKRWGSVDADKS